MRRLAVQFIGIQQLFRLGRNIARTTLEFESLQATLKVLQGSTEGANRAFRRLEKFAVETPFQLDELVRGFVSLRALGITPTNRELTALGDLAAVMGRSFVDVSASVRSAAAGMTLPMKNLGVDARVTGNQITLSFGDMSRTVDRSADAILDALTEIAEHKFAGAMEERMNTLGGALSNFQDSWDQLVRAIVNSNVRGALQNVVRAADEFVGNLARAFEQNRAPEFLRAVGKVWGLSLMAGMADAIAEIPDIGVAILDAILPDWLPQSFLARLQANVVGAALDKISEGVETRLAPSLQAAREELERIVALLEQGANTDTSGDAEDTAKGWKDTSKWSADAVDKWRKAKEWTESIKVKTGKAKVDLVGWNTELDQVIRSLNMIRSLMERIFGKKLGGFFGGLLDVASMIPGVGGTIATMVKIANSAGGGPSVPDGETAGLMMAEPQTATIILPPADPAKIGRSQAFQVQLREGLLTAKSQGFR